MITDGQIKALDPAIAAIMIACREGGYVAAGYGEHKGHLEKISASAIRALVRRGYLVEQLSPDGGYAARLSMRARSALEMIK